MESTAAPGPPSPASPPSKTYTDFAGFKAGRVGRDHPAKSVHLCRRARTATKINLS
jgi:hypothetical protein